MNARPSVDGLVSFLREPKRELAPDEIYRKKENMQKCMHS